MNIPQHPKCYAEDPNVAAEVAEEVFILGYLDADNIGLA
jgi:hypothetical protein